MKKTSICLTSAFAALALCSCSGKDASVSTEAQAPAVEAPAAEAPAVQAPAAEVPAAQAPASVSETGSSTNDPPATEVEVEDKVVVRINGTDAVMQSEIDEIVAQFLASNGSRIPSNQVERVKRNMVRDMARNLAMQFLLKAEADKAGFFATDEDRTAALARFGIPDKAAALEAFGLTEEKFDKMFDTNIAIEKLLASQTNSVVAPTDEEIRARFDKIVADHPEAATKPASVTASHILVKVDSGASEEDKAAAKAKIDAIRERAAAGEDFAALAKENSDCPSKEQGGSLGSFGRGQMVKPFEDAAFSQEIGVVGPVVETQFGYHIILVSDRTEEGKVEFEEVKPNLADGMLREKWQEAVSSFMDKVRDAATIEYVGLPAEGVEVTSDVIEIPGEAAEEKSEQPRELPQWAQ